MSLNPYPNIIISSDHLTYDFTSKGKQDIKKRVRFSILDDKEQIYNLALCTVLINGTEDFETISRNGDMPRIFETIGMIVLDYTDKYPDRKIYFEGSDKLRTRRYQLSLFSNLRDILPLFIIEGLTKENNGMIIREMFETGKNYDAFIFNRK